MTKITVFGQEEKKAIELCYVFNALLKESDKDDIPSADEFDHITLLGKSYNNEYDLIMGWYESDDYKFVYLGHWNDGVV